MKARRRAVRQAASLSDSNDKWFIVDGDKRGQQFDEVGQPLFSPDGKIACRAKRGEKWLIVVSDKAGPEFDQVGKPRFSPGGKLAYRARRGEKWLIVVGDKAGPEFDQVSEPRFSPDGKKVAYGAQQGRELRRKVMDVE